MAAEGFRDVNWLIRRLAARATAPADAEVWWQIEERGEYEWHRLAGVEKDETNARVGLEGLREEVRDKEFRLVRITREVVDPELSAGRAAGGVQPAPAEPSPHRHHPGWCEFGGAWACQSCREEQAASAGSGSTDQPPAEGAHRHEPWQIRGDVDSAYCSACGAAVEPGSELVAWIRSRSAGGSTDGAGTP